MIKKDLRQPCSLSILSEKKDLIGLTPYHWQPCDRNFVTSEKDGFAIFLQNKERDVPHSAKIFAKPSFSDVTKFRNAGFPMVRSQMD